MKLLATVLRAPDLREKLAVEAIEPIVMSPEEFAASSRPTSRWTKLAKERRSSWTAVSSQKLLQRMLLFV
jgi:hypothetical protein